MERDQRLIQSKHLSFERLAEGVYAAIHIEGGAAISNAGIVLLGTDGASELDLLTIT